MEQQLDIVLNALTKDVPIRYLIDSNDTNSLKPGEIHIRKYKIDTCPDQIQVLNAMQKRIGRSDTMKSQKHTLGICTLLLLSSGYCVSSLTLPGVDDFFIERCWECVQVVSQNIPLELSQWMQEAMGKRTPSGYSVLFCTSRLLLSSTNLLKDSISGTGQFSVVDAQELGIPNSLWHRKDAIHQTMILHLKLQNADLS